MLSWIEEDISSGAVILDCGAGRGRHPYYFSQATVIGIDPDPCVLENPLLDEAYVASGDETRFPDNFFDCIFSFMVMEHLQYPRGFLAEMYRILKPGGSFYFATPNSYHYFVWISKLIPEAFAERYVVSRGRKANDHFPTYYKFNSPRIIRRIAKEVGFVDRSLRFHEHLGTRSYFPRLCRFIPYIYTYVVKLPFLAPFRVSIIGKLTKK